MYDLAVIGGGLAGMSAGLRARELGARVVVLERTELVGGGGNARISGGLLHLAWRSMDESPDDLYQALIRVTGGEIQPAIARALANNARRCAEWIAKHGVSFSPKGPAPYMKWAMAPHILASGTRLNPEHGPDKAMTALYHHFVRLGGEVSYGASAERLERLASGPGWNIGGRYITGDSFRVEAKAVLIADGGFQGNPEMLCRYVGPNADRAVLRAMPHSTGEGLRMALEVGAKAVGLGSVYGHMVSRQALHDERFWPYPALDKLCLQGVIVDRQGRLFEHSATDGVELVTQMARTEDPRGYSVVCDDHLWSTAGADDPYGAIAPNPGLEEMGAKPTRAESLEELATLCGADPRALTAAVEQHNRSSATPLLKPPYYWIPVAPGITFTMGGIAIDHRGQVVDRSGKPIPGLYAAGSCVGGVHGGSGGGYLGGLAVAVELGVIAAEAAVEDIQGSALGQSTHTA